MKRDVDTMRHLQRRARLAQSLGLQQGNLYAKHREKFLRSVGYVKDGHLRRYVACNNKRPIGVKGGHGEEES